MRFEPARAGPEGGHHLEGEVDIRPGNHDAFGEVQGDVPLGIGCREEYGGHVLARLAGIHLDVSARQAAAADGQRGAFVGAFELEIGPEGS